MQTVAEWSSAAESTTAHGRQQVYCCLLCCSTLDTGSPRQHNVTEPLRVVPKRPCQLIFRQAANGMVSEDCPFSRHLAVQCDPQANDALPGYTLLPELPSTASHRL